MQPNRSSDGRDGDLRETGASSSATYICLVESEASLRDAVKVLSVEDEGITVEPVQLTRFHAKILQPSFSIKH